MGRYGCALASVTAVLNAQGKSISLPDLNRKMADNGGYQYGDMLIWSKAADVTGMRYKGVYSQSTADQELSKGNPVIVRLTNYLSGSSYPYHFVVLTTKNSNGTYNIMDPWGGKHTSNVNIQNYSPSFRATYIR